MRVPAPGEAAAQLPWLSPCAASLVALAHSSSATWEQLRSDPGAVLLVLRQTSATLGTSGWSFFPTLLHEPAVCEGAQWHLGNSPPCFVDWGQAPGRAIHQVAHRTARLAHHVARRCGRCDPENAWIAGLLAPLGWLAVCAASPGQVAACLNDPAFKRQPMLVQRRLWGLDQAAIGRRLAQRWNLPGWLVGIIGRLGLPADVARSLGSDPDLLRIVQLAASLAQREDSSLYLTIGAGPVETAAPLGIPFGELPALQQEADPADANALAVWEPPTAQPMLRELLLLAAENRRLRGTAPLERLEAERDDLHAALEARCADEAERLQGRKLSALAEFAAGAGHEINNPLAVISSQAQYLLGRLRSLGEEIGEEAPPNAPETNLADPANSEGAGAAPASDLRLLTHDWDRSLQTIVDQARRIHGILRDLWQFARPPRPQKEAVDLPGLIQQVGASLNPLAVQRKVHLRYDQAATAAGRPHGLTVVADPGQLRTALTCLVRNAIEAAPAEGWAEVRVETPADDQVEVLVEDNGTPPELAQREHLFDPFYSGRQAGRGRGLGLPTAWQLARAHGGEVRLVGIPGRPTRFVLSLPLTNGSNGTAALPHAEGRKP